LAIYCAIHCLAVKREKLWSRFNNGSNLLFKEQDFNHPTDSEVFQTLWKLPDVGCRALVGRLVLACPPSPLHAVPLLDEVTNGYVLPLTPAEERAVDAILKVSAEAVWATVLASDEAVPAAPPNVTTPTIVPPTAARECVDEADTVPFAELVESHTPQPSRGSPLSAARGRVTTATGTRDERTSGDYIYPTNPPQSPHACWLNLLMSGVAQIYLGQTGKGLAILGASFASYTVVPVMGSLIICIVAVVDAYQVGSALRSGRPVGKWEFFPNK
jgi:hypothetical protein